MIKRTLYHFHFCCGLGGGAAGFNRARPRVGNVEAEWVCLGGVDVDPAGLRDFESFTPDELARSLIILAKVADEKVVAQHSVPELDQSRSALTEAQMRRIYENSTEAENERLGFAAFARLMRRAEAVHQIAATPGKEVPQAWLDVQTERRRQVEAEGWTPEHDDLYCAAELPRAAAAYILSGANDEAPAIWPFVAKWWKPRDARANYVRAGALILAEIERLDRAGISQNPQPGATTASS